MRIEPRTLAPPETGGLFSANTLAQVSFASGGRFPHSGCAARYCILRIFRLMSNDAIRLPPEPTLDCEPHWKARRVATRIMAVPRERKAQNWPASCPTLVVVPVVVGPQTARAGRLMVGRFSRLYSGEAVSVRSRRPPRVV